MAVEPGRQMLFCCSWRAGGLSLPVATSGGYRVQTYSLQMMSDISLATSHVKGDRLAGILFRLESQALCYWLAGLYFGCCCLLWSQWIAHLQMPSRCQLSRASFVGGACNKYMSIVAQLQDNCWLLYNDCCVWRLWDSHWPTGGCMSVDPGRIVWLLVCRLHDSVLI